MHSITADVINAVREAGGKKRNEMLPGRVMSLHRWLAAVEDQQNVLPILDNALRKICKHSLLDVGITR